MGRLKKPRPLDGMGQFVAVPVRVISSPAYHRLSHPAARLLWDVATQCHGDDNGRLLAGIKAMRAKGWTSCDTLNRATKELVEAGFLHQTVQGHRPNKASWFAVTFRHLNKLTGYDPHAEAGFKMWAFEQKAPIKNACLNPSGGQEDGPIAPPDG